jgi:hypothetical protein
MHQSSSTPGAAAKRQRPRAAAVFTAAFVAGAIAAVGVNRVLDVHIAQSRPQVECEPIFVALRSLPQGSPVTVWDVALRDWPKAMLPTTALRAHDSFEGMLLRHPLREGQPLLSVQLVQGDMHGPYPRPTATDPSAPLAPRPQAAVAPSAEADLWAPATPLTQAPAPPAEPLRREPQPAAAAEPIPFVAAEPAESPPPAATTAAAPLSAPATDVEVATDIAAATEPAASEDAASESPVATDVSDVTALATAAPVTAQVDVAVADDAGVTDEALEAAAASGGAVEVAEQPAAVVEAVGQAPTLVAAAPMAEVPTPVEPPVRPLQSVAIADPVSSRSATTQLAAPVPTSPATDIEAPLASMTAGQQGTAPTPADQPAATGGAASVLRLDEPAAAAATARPATMRYLVVPERIALQADASFTRQPPAVKALPPTTAGESGQRPTGPPQAQRRSGGKPSVSGSGKPSVSGKPSTFGRSAKPPAAAGGQQRQPGQQRQAATQPSRGFSGWFPGLGANQAAAPSGR